MIDKKKGNYYMRPRSCYIVSKFKTNLRQELIEFEIYRGFQSLSKSKHGKVFNNSSRVYDFIRRYCTFPLKNIKKTHPASCYFLQKVKAYVPCYVRRGTSYKDKIVTTEIRVIDER